MKVCTDACLFGAWVTDFLQQKKITAILDVGTGTGLISLMLAQKITAAIDAVEIDTPAFEQATQNVEQSNFKLNIQVINTDISLYQPERKYDVIVSNPPFFEADLKSTQQNKNDAKHDTALTLDVLYVKAKALLKNDGYFAVLLPFHRTDYFINESLLHGFYCAEKVLVKQTPKHSYFRSMLLFSLHKTATVQKEITIKDAEGNYTSVFTQLLKDYYIYL